MSTRQKPTLSRLNDTPRTDRFVQESQLRMIPFQVSFFHLLELTRELEREVNRLREDQKRKKNKEPILRNLPEAGSFHTHGKESCPVA